MLRQSLAVLAVSAVASVAGCSSGGGYGASASTPPQQVELQQPMQQATELAAYSAKAAYPETQPIDTFKSAAIVNRETGLIKIYNFTDKPVGESKVWVNRSFVCRIPGIAPQSKVVISTNQLYDNSGNTFTSQKDPVSTVQLQTDHSFYNVEGPAME